MNFEIVGVHPANRGAALMLEAIRERLRQSYPQARFAVPAHWPVETRLAYGLWLTPGRQVRTLSRLGLLDRAPPPFRESLGYLPADAVDVLIDASGFGYGDFWGLSKLSDRLAGRLAWWKQAPKKAILLPQALGPFEQPGMAEAFGRALDHLDLAFVRDASSQAYVEAVLPGRANVLRAPDFTNLLKPALPRRLDHVSGLSLVIPNEKMVSGKGADVHARYVEFLVTAVTVLRAAGKDVALLLHEGDNDRAIAAAVNARLTLAVPVIDEPSPLDTKAVIAAADMIVSSRFHGLVSALSSAVPALSCGWSHKYRELMTDYGCPELALDFDDQAAWRPSLERLVDAAGRSEFRQRLGAHADVERQKTQTMWTRVLEVIDAR